MKPFPLAVQILTMGSLPAAVGAELVAAVAVGAACCCCSCQVAEGSSLRVRCASTGTSSGYPIQTPQGKGRAPHLISPHHTRENKCQHIMLSIHHTTLGGGVRIVLSHSRNGIVSAADGGTRTARQ